MTPSFVSRAAGNPADASRDPARDPFLLADDDDQGGLNFLEIWRTILKYKFQIIALGLVGALLAWVIVARITPIYQARATVMFETRSAKVVAIQDPIANISADQQHFQTQTEILRSRDLGLKTIARARLWEHPDYDPRKPREDWVADTLARFGMGKGQEAVEEANARQWSDKQLAEAVYGAFAGALKVAPLGRNTQIVTITFDSPDPVLAARVANAHAETYIKNDLDARFEMGSGARSWLRERLVELKDQLTASEKALQAFRESKGLVDIGGSAQTGVSQQTTSLRERLIEAQVRRAEAEIAWQAVTKAGSNADLSLLPVVQRNAAVASGRDAVVAAERKIAELSERYGPEHPRMTSAKAELDSARAALRGRVDQVVAAFTREYEQARAQEQALRSSLASAEESVRKVNRFEFELGVLQREVETNRQLYDMFLTRGKETDISSDLQNPVARVIDHAVNGYKVKPDEQRIVLITLVLCLLAGCAAAVGIEMLDKTIKTTEDAERKLQQPVLTSLPILQKEFADRHAAARAVVDQPDSVFAESIRTARSGIMLSSLDADQRTLLVTSTLPGEGKTVFAMNVAEALAQQGSKTLLIECDMRRPTIARAIDLDPGIPGLSALVAGKAELEECIHHIQGSALDIIVSGKVPPNPQELLASRRFAETLAALKAQYEVIILDSPPVELVADAAVLAPQCTGIAFMVKASETPEPLINKALVRLQRAGGNVVGVVLSQLDFRKAHRYYGEYSGYGAGSYKYGYYHHAYGKREAGDEDGKARGKGAVA